MQVIVLAALAVAALSLLHSHERRIPVRRHLLTRASLANHREYVRAKYGAASQEDIILDNSENVCWLSWWSIGGGG